jgi:hypothetical protein
MFRTLPRTALLMAALACFARPAFAQSADPLELARGLRENGMADLALDYLDDLAAKKPAPALAAVLPLERARAQLELAQREGDDAKRDALITQARVELEKFLSGNATHPRRPEAALTLARLVSAQAKSLLTKAYKLPDPAQVKAEKARARPIFQDAAKRFGQAAAAFAKQLDQANLTAARKRALTTDLYQAELDRATNQLKLADTYDTSGEASADDRSARGKAVQQAEKLFKQLAEADEKHPLCWVARAWMGASQVEGGNQNAAQATFKSVTDAAKKVPAAAAGARLVRFFEMQGEYLKALGQRTPTALRKAQTEVSQWLAEPANRSARPAPEVYAARYYLGRLALTQGELGVRRDKAGNITDVPSSAQTHLRRAIKDFGRLIEPANDYSDRAAEDRTLARRLLVGNADREPAQIHTFEEAVMSAEVQMYKASREAKTPDERAKLMHKAIALYERADQLPVPKDAARDEVDAQVNRAFAYLAAGQPYQAAILGEHLAHTSRASGPAARAGLYAMQAYLQAATKLDVADRDGRKADRERAIQMAHYLDKQYPDDPNTNAARIQLGDLLRREAKYAEAFDVLSRVTPDSPRLGTARLMEGLAAFELLRPQPEGVANKSKLSAKEKAAIWRRVIADLTRAANVPTSASADDARIAVLLELQLAELYITEGAKGYPKAEQLALAAAKKTDTFTALSAADKQELKFRAEDTRVRAAWAEGMALYKAGKYSAVMTKMTPLLTAATKEGSAAAKVKPKDEAALAAAKRLDADRRDKLLVLALQTRLKEGAAGADKMAGLFDLMKRLGGSLDASIEALTQLVHVIRPQLDELRKQGKADEADKLTRGVGQILDKVATEPGITPRVRMFLGRAMKDLGNYDKAVAVLQKIPTPAAAELAKKPADLDEKNRMPVLVYRGSRLELAQTYRRAKKFDDAAKTLREAMGTKEKPGWAAKAIDFRKESAYLLEDRAEAATDPMEAMKLWGEANDKWRQLEAEILGPWRKLMAGKKDNRSAMIALLDLKQLPPSDLLPKDGTEIRTALSASKPPQWLTKLIVERVPDKDGKLQPNPVAKEYAEQLRNTVNRMEAQVKPMHFDRFYDHARCLTRANATMLKDKPTELDRRMSAIAQQIQDLQTANPDLPEETKAKFTTLMEQYPPLKQAYANLGKPNPLIASTPTDTASTAATTSAADAKPNETESKPVAPTAATEGNGNLGLIIGALVGLLALAGVLGYIVKSRRPAPVRASAARSAKGKRPERNPFDRNPFAE